ncbi:restriction endonuclease subunit S [Stenotrophomonas sp. 278]|uniref:restriction endonuclease subunit S n=1 Tax=Stenotrophomonas sp. 278 TaxID=2479851 RepID=UPI000F661D66|nr:restriction endonuclease subunit S [Stenotrophomonas sp. 278]RRU14967.1 restriction endonuclease subunit S [Stenotrophomonas sp. 278]
MVFDSVFSLYQDWETLSLGEVCQRGGGNVQTGPFGSQLHASDYVAEGIPSVMPQNIGDNSILNTGIARITEADAQRLSKYRIREGDIVYSRRGDVERRALVRKSEEGWLCGTGCLRIRFGEGVVYPRYAAHYLGHPAVREWIVRHAHGATMPNLNTTILSELPFVLPPWTVQVSIGDVIELYDQKIDLNRRITQTLEAMAQAIFKSWFVDFDPVKAKIAAIEQGQDPLRAAMRAISGKTDAELAQMPRGHHDQLAATATLFPDAMEESELGEIPKGWAFQAADLMAEVGIGKTPPRKEPQWFSEGEGDWRWVSIKDMGTSGVFQQRSSEFLTSGAVSRFNVRVVPDRTVLLSFKLTIGRVAITDGPMVTNEAIAHFKLPDDSAISSEYLYLYLKSFDYSKLGSTSSIADAVNSKTIREMPIIIANSDLISCFTKSVIPVFQEVRNRQNEIATLGATRDTLLPKLLSGEVEVPA